MLRYSADWRSVAYMVVTTGLLAFNWLMAGQLEGPLVISLGEFSLFIPTFLWACFMAVTVTVMAHNHNHLPMWKAKPLNTLTDYWLTLFYGFPVFAWIPTHNRNHHKFTNREGDYTITYRMSEGNNLFTLLTYPSISSFHQQYAIKDYLKRLWAKSKNRFWMAFSQYVLLAAYYGVALFLDWKKALFFIIVPHQVGLFFVMVFNYVQHVHADEESKYNHSRNIVGPGLNLLLFNNGYHTVHHNNPGTHWSLNKAEHDKIKHLIDPSLNEQTFWGMIFKFYILGAFSSRFASKSMRLERMNAGEVASDAPEAAPAE